MSLSHLGEVHVIRHGGALLDHDVPVGTHALEGLGDDRTLIAHTRCRVSRQYWTS